MGKTVGRKEISLDFLLCSLYSEKMIKVKPCVYVRETEKKKEEEEEKERRETRRERGKREKGKEREI
jgi:hypothetical protein